jgi:cadmium resistance protein CadD (predicted permease)
MNKEDSKETMESYTKTLAINLFGQLLMVTTVSWAAECKLFTSYHTTQEILHTIAWMMLLGCVVTNLLTVACAHTLRAMEGYEELAQLSFRSGIALTLLQLSMYFLTPTPFKLAFMAICAAMLLRWWLAKGKFLLPTNTNK